MKYLITGGAGYIGSTIASALEDAGHTPIILDSLITGRREFTHGRIFYHADIADRPVLEQIFKDHPDIQATVHCAALIVVPESTARPYEYYRENVGKSIELFHVLHELGYSRFVFSSSASVYDLVPGFMVREDSPLIRRMLDDALVQAGYKDRQGFSDGQEAWKYLEKLAREHSPETLRAVCAGVISDIEMPRMDGFTLTRSIRENPVLKDLPVVLFSSLISKDNEKKGIQVGATAQISKPVSYTHLTLPTIYSV